jgi:gamma-glutamyltranspeptidase / glutathione hydrolase
MGDELIHARIEKARPSLLPVTRGRKGMVVSGHHLATRAGMRILEKGGNAIDAGVAAGLCLGILMPEMVSFAGVAPIMVYLADRTEIKTISGVGTWPKKASLDYFIEKHGGKIPVGIDRTVVPAAPDAWITALRHYGTLSFEEISRDAIELAEGGFPVYSFLSNNIKEAPDHYRRWPSQAEIYLPNGRPPEPGEVFVQKDLARTIQKMVAAEQRKRFLGRAAALEAARNEFYRGEIADAVLEYFQKHGGLLGREDLNTFHVNVDPPLSTTYRGFEVYSCRPWCQGPVLLQMLNVLEAYDLRALGHNTTEYIHLITEAAKLVFADREAFYGDPDVIEVPVEGLLSKDYASARSGLIDPAKACPGMPPAGNPWSRTPEIGSGGAQRQGMPRPEHDAPKTPEWDTSYVCVVDRFGNAFSASPSDGGENTPTIPGTGLAVSSRGTQSWVDKHHPSSIQPGKRPRLTPSPSMVLKNGKLFMPFGTPGGDVQCQAMLQVFLNMVEFQMDPQLAVEAPRFASFSFPNSFYPHDYHPGLLRVEKGVGGSSLSRLREKGHKIEEWPDWAWRAGGVCCIQVDSVNGILTGAADPRRESCASGW